MKHIAVYEWTEDRVSVSQGYKREKKKSIMLSVLFLIYILDKYVPGLTDVGLAGASL